MHATVNRYTETRIAIPRHEVFAADGNCSEYKGNADTMRDRACDAKRRPPIARRLAGVALLLMLNSLAGATDYFGPDYRPVRGENQGECARKLNARGAGWCEIRHSDEHPSISAVWPENLDERTRMVVGPASILVAWNSAAHDKKRHKLYFSGGGASDYGGNEVYEFDLKQGKWRRLTDPSPLDKLFVNIEATKRPAQPWPRFCWVPDVRKVPASVHTYDGLIFSHKTNTLFLYVMRPATGSCFEDKNGDYSGHPELLVDSRGSMGWYEFNPDPVKSRNGLAPVTWRRIFDFDDLKAKAIERGYPVSAELGNGDLLFGSKSDTGYYDPLNPRIASVKQFSSRIDRGDGTREYDKYRNMVWSLHKTALLAFDANSGKLLREIEAAVPHGKSIAIGADRKLYSWNGMSDISVFDPDGHGGWKTMEWGPNGPPTGDRKVYGKWVYLDDENLFVGLSTDKTGVWVYKHPATPVYTEYSDVDPQQLVTKATPGDVVTIPPGTYRRGLFIDKSLTVRLKDVLLRETVKQKGIINVSCDDCDVVIEDFRADGAKANCQWGNCAGIKAEGKNFRLMVRNASISKTVIGILTDNRGGELTLIDSVIEDTGLGSKSRTLGHGFYAGDIDKVVVKNSVIRTSYKLGHLFKSRAPQTLIENSIVAGLGGQPSRVVDFPCGGKLSIVTSVLQQAAQADNADMISVGTEAGNCGGSARPSDVTIKNSWLIFDREYTAEQLAAKHALNRVFTWRAPLLKLEISGNRIIEGKGGVIFDEEGKVPDLSEANETFGSRKAAGIGADELPAIRSN